MSTHFSIGTPGSDNTVGRYRWKICALIFLATSINYMDRSVIGVLGPTLQYKVFHWSDQDFAYINAAFKAAYAIGMVSMGAIVDRFGTKIGYSISIAIWSLFGMLHAAVRPAFSVIGFSIARFGLGFGEAGNYPSAVKTVAEWFPRTERALVSGIFNAGANVGAILAPLLIPLVVGADGSNWQLGFLFTGLFSAIWVAGWLRVYDRPADAPRLSKAEFVYIHRDSAVDETAGNIPWLRVLSRRETWAFAIAKTTDAVSWFYLFWGGKYLYDRFGLDIKSLALPLVVIFVVGDIGSVSGGWLSSHFIRQSWGVNRARKTTLVLSVLCIVPVILVPRLGTRFEINDRFFQRLQSTTSAIERARDGSRASLASQPTEKVPAPDLFRLRVLYGRRFDSAKDFLTAVHAVLPQNKIPAGGAQAAGTEAAILTNARSDNLYWIAVVLIALAVFGHQSWMANLYAVVMDVFPRKATASVTGIGGTVGAITGLLADLGLGKILGTSGPSGYFFAFLIAGSIYPVALGMFQLLMPKMIPLEDNLRHALE